MFMMSSSEEKDVVHQSVASTSEFTAINKANRASESSDMKTKIKNIEMPELSGSEGSRVINHDMETVLKGNLKQLEKRASIFEPVSKVTDLVVPRRKFFFFEVSPETLIKWSSKPLKNPLSDIKPEMAKDALKCFAAIQRFMGDRAPSDDGKGDILDLRFVADRGMCVVGLRNEIYLQIYKQLNENPSPVSVLKGWQILCVLSNCFSPAKALLYIMENLLESKAVKKAEAEEHLTNMEWEKLQGKELDNIRIALMARFCINKLKISMKTPRGRVPAPDEIEHFLKAPFKFTVFGETLQNIVKNPKNVDDDQGKLPKVLRFLSEAVLVLGGHSCEGIFRVPGDLDSVMMLKMRIENGVYDLSGIQDPAVPASLLKMWVRELAEPVIPNRFYARCLTIKRVQEAMDVVDQLPELNRSCLKYLAKYLQVVGDPINQPKTKMSVSNLAIVFAPNLLRCPDDNPLVILQNAKHEQHFVKLIVNYLDE